MVEFVLAFILAKHLDSVAPEIIEPFFTREACMITAAKRNKLDERLKEKPFREAEAQYVCMKIEKVMT